MIKQSKKEAEQIRSRSTAAPGLLAALKAFSWVASVLAILVGCVVLVGWAIDISVLKRVLPGLVAMNPVTALAFILAGASLWLLRTHQIVHRSRRIGQGLAFVVALIGLLKLVEMLFGWGVGIDQSLFREGLESEVGATESSNRMSPNTALNFLALGCALLILDRRTRHGRYPAQYLVLAAGAASLLALVSYVYGAQHLYGVGYTPMALHTAVTFAVLLVGLLCARLDRGLMFIVTSDSLGGVIMRRLLPAAVLVPVVLGWLRLKGEQYGLYDTEFGVSLVAVATATILAALVWWSARLVYRLDAERLRAEAARSQLVSIVENSNDAIDSKTLDGTIISFNPSAERLFGYSEDEIEGKNISILTPPERTDEIKEVLRMVGRGETVSEYEAERVSKGGRRIPVSLTVSPVRNSEGEIVGASAIARDITERKLAEQELNQAKEVAEEANRAKSEFLANMSHEIRTPMNGVIGMTGLLLDTELDSEQREYAETVRSSAEHLLTVINDILDFSKIEAGKMHLEIIDFDLEASVEEAVGLLAERANRKGLELASLVEADVPIALRGDPGRIRQVLVNLLGNAVKFTEEGEVVLRVKLVEETDSAAVVCFEVKDTGIGMTEEQQSRLFESFSQADASTTRKYGGTGLGLAISKQFVELMRGEMGVESERGVGSTFFFTLPLEKLSEGAQQRVALIPRAELHDLRVLVVDDNETNRKILQEQLSSWGVKSGSAEDGPKALEKLREAAMRDESYELVILDMQMPEMDGLELARRIKKDPSISSTQLIMLSSVGRVIEGEETSEAGIEAYLTKPVKQSRLYDIVTTVMGPSVEEVPVSPSTTEVSGPSLTEAPLTSAIRVAKTKGRSCARVLVAEDNAVNQKVAVRMLEKLGYRADVAANGLEAVEALSRIPYSAVLMDVQMPEMDGYEATAEIRKREGPENLHTPVIAMTANAMQGDREKTLQAGMDDYVSKPVKVEELGTILERWIPQAGVGAPAVEETTDDRSAVGSDGTDPLDRSVLAGLRDLGGPELLGELGGLLLEGTPPQIKALREAIEAGDALTVETVAHTIKGSCGNMGATGMSTICAELEGVGRSGELEHAPVLVDRLEAEFERVRSALEGEMEERSG